MKIWVISDLHLEFGEPFHHAPPKDVDVVVCAGDVATNGIVPSIRWLTKHIGQKVPVVFVAGNHEFYRASIRESVLAGQASVGYPCLHFLENDVAKIDGVLFVGGTLWTDFRLFGRDPQVAMSYAWHDMNDFKKIKFSETPFVKFTPMLAYRKHLETREYISDELRKRGGGPTVVVTHHAPSPRSVAVGSRHDPLQACYASDLEDLILEAGPTLWVHGHVHRRNDYFIGSTRVVSNPRGYPSQHSGFDPDYVVEI